MSYYLEVGLVVSIVLMFAFSEGEHWRPFAYITFLLTVFLLAVCGGCASPAHAQSKKAATAVTAVSVTDQGPMSAEQFQQFVAACKDFVADVNNLNVKDTTHSAAMQEENDRYLRATQEQRDRIVGKQARLSKQATADAKWEWDMTALVFRPAKVVVPPPAAPAASAPATPAAVPDPKP